MWLQICEDPRDPIGYPKRRNVMLRQHLDLAVCRLSKDPCSVCFSLSQTEKISVCRWKLIIWAAFKQYFLRMALDVTRMGWNDESKHFWCAREYEWRPSPTKAPTTSPAISSYAFCIILQNWFRRGLTMPDLIWSNSVTPSFVSFFNTQVMSEQIYLGHSSPFLPFLWLLIIVNTAKSVT